MIQHGNAVFTSRTVRALALLVMAVLAVSCGRSRGELVVVDQAGALERARIEEAAAPLRDLGATVAVFSIAKGESGVEDFTRKLDTVGLLRSGQIAPAAIAFYVSFQPHYSELRAGADWSTALPDATLRAIRLELLNPSLRAGDATGGVVAALTALNERARYGPFGIRRDYAAAALWIVLVAGMFLLVFGPRSLADWLRWGPIGRFVAWLWARTPPGRAQERRRFAAQLALARQRLHAAADEARTLCQGMQQIAGDLQERLERADSKYAQLDRPAPDDAALPGELDALTGVYRQLHTDLAAFERRLKQQAATLSARAAQARERIARVQTSFQRASTRSRRAWKTRRTISAGGRQRLVELQERQALFDQQRAAIELAGLTPAEWRDRLAQLTHDYEVLYGDATALWQSECPQDYAASISAPRPPSYDSATSETSYSSPSTTSSSSDYASDWSSPSSEPSSDGGSW
jgi:hypothetical protein